MTNKDLLKDIIITLGVCGASTAYKSVNLVEQLRHLGAKVRVVLSDEARKYVTPLTFERVSGEDVIVEPSASGGERVVQSSLTNESDVTVIAPASFSFIGKLASGLGTEPLTELVSSSNNPVVLAPSMNRNLYSSETLRSYLNQIKESGFHIVEPKTWELEVKSDQEVPLTIVINKIISKVKDILKEDQLLENKRILVTSGPTRDLFSQPSFTGGATTRSLGYSLSQQARQMGGEVTLVSGPTEQIPPTGVGVVWTRSIEELDELLTAEFSEYDLILMAGVASDWYPELNPNTFKKEKTKRLDLDIPETPDLTRKLGRLKDEKQVLIEFRTGSEDQKGRTRESLAENDIDALFSLLREKEGEDGTRDLFAGTFLFKSGDGGKVQAQTGTRFSREILRKIGQKYFR
ncbi:hypothetical protein K9M78_06585 [Candidatus Bipolaricaulota bacterium]|nr:hypothetical protein [Candidatus Bipolaricaulota bacterium]